MTETYLPPGIYFPVPPLLVYFSGIVAREPVEARPENSERFERRSSQSDGMKCAPFWKETTCVLKEVCGLIRESLPCSQNIIRP